MIHRDRRQAEGARGQLGLSGAEVARRAGLRATCYGHYLQDIQEPDLAILVRICHVLGLRLDVLLAYDQADPASDALMVKCAAVAAYVDVLDGGSLDLAMLVVQAIAAIAGLRSVSPGPADAPLVTRRPRTRRGSTPKDAPAGR